MGRVISRFLELSGQDRRLVLEAFLCLGAARAVLLAVPFRIVARRLGRQKKGLDSVSGLAAAPAAAKQVGEAVGRVSPHTPWESTCLAQAVATRVMLRRRGLESTLYLGMRKGESGAPQAHAWLRCGRDILVGAAGYETYVMLTAFHDDASPEEPVGKGTAR